MAKLLAVTGDFINGVLRLFNTLTPSKLSLDGFVVGVRFINTAAVVPLWVLRWPSEIGLPMTVQVCRSAAEKGLSGLK